MSLSLIILIKEYVTYKVNIRFIVTTILKILLFTYLILIYFYFILILSYQNSIVRQLFTLPGGGGIIFRA
jgi:hypothetical protein